MNLRLTTTVTVSTTPAYTAKDLIGGKITLTDDGLVSPVERMIHTVTIIDQSDQKSALDVIFFRSDPSGTTFTDNAALDIADADLLKALAPVSIAAADYLSFNDNAIATKLGVGLPIQLAENKLYAALVCRGTPTYVATTDITLEVLII